MTALGIFRGSGKARPLRPQLLLWTILVGALVGLLGLGGSVEQDLRGMRNLLRDHPASGDIVIVSIDDRSLTEINAWPWPRRIHARLTTELARLGAKRIFYDIDFSSHSNPVDDAIFAKALQPLGTRVVMTGNSYVDPTTRESVDNLPIAPLTARSGLAATNFSYLVNGSVIEQPYSFRLNGRIYRSVSADLAEITPARSGNFPIDYSIAPNSIPRISAVDILRRHVPAQAIAGKDIVIGAGTEQLASLFTAPWRGRLPPPYFHVLGAETLKSGIPIMLGWMPSFLMASILVACCMRLRRAMHIIAAMSAMILVLLLLPLATEPKHIYVDIVPSLAMLVTQIAMLSWREMRRILRDRATTNAVSGLRNLNALRMEADLLNQILVVARVHNFSEVLSTLPAAAEKLLVGQIASRLTLGTVSHDLYQGDDGVFAWFVDGEVATLGEHLEALHSVFRSPVVIADNTLDLAVTFGIDIGYDRSVANRLGSALVAAGEAADDGGKWKQFDPAKLKDAAWKLSLLSQLDAAIDGGDLWVAYQPKLHLATGTIVGAEALVRWTHPEKGNISPIEFVAAAEQHNRIEKLTMHVLDRAILAAATINGHGIPFNIAVNLSARLLEEPGLTESIADLLVQHHLPARMLTLEITETAALTSDHALDILHALRDTGVTISIDDYGTGLSTLDYLKKIPASEIKIDKSFVQAMGNSTSDLLIVNSTIQLAHSLGHRVVAEGVETEETLDKLVKLDCDMAQGYFIGRPMTFQALARCLVSEEKALARHG